MQRPLYLLLTAATGLGLSLLAGCAEFGIGAFPDKADLSDACTLVSPDEITSVTGGAVTDKTNPGNAAPQDIAEPSSADSTCVYTVQSNYAASYQTATVTIKYMTPDEFDQIKTGQTPSGVATGPQTPIPRVGDQAYWQSESHTLTVLKGKHAFAVELPLSRDGLAIIDGAIKLAHCAAARLP
jgi:hypothetical protein